MPILVFKKPDDLLKLKGWKIEDVIPGRLDAGTGRTSTCFVISHPMAEGKVLLTISPMPVLTLNGSLISVTAGLNFNSEDAPIQEKPEIKGES